MTDESDFESLQNMTLHSMFGHVLNEDYKQKNSKLKLISCVIIIAIICLFIGFYVGSHQHILFDANTNVDITANPLSIQTIPILPPATNHEKKKTFSIISILNRIMRPNEDECSARRCCQIRDGLTPQYLPNDLNCNQLTDYECGANDEFCEWDCDPPLYGRNGIIRTFHNISLFQGAYQEPDFDIYRESDFGLESYTNCLQSGTLLTVDDCGIQYNEELDPEELKTFCQFRQEMDLSIFFDAEQEDADPLGPIRRLLMIGKDDREYPWSTELFLSFDNYKADKSMTCTATMISPRWAITSAHCLWGNGDFYKNIRLYKNVRSCNDITSNNEYKFETAIVFTEYIETKNADHDIGVLRLQKEPGLDYLGFGYDSGFAENIKFNNIQYGGDDNQDCRLWHGYCSFDEWTTYRMISDECDVFDGASGSPYYKYWPEEKDKHKRAIYGIYSGHYDDDYNVATRITSGKYNAICNHLKMDHPVC